MKNKIPPPILLLITGTVMWFVAHSEFAYQIKILFPLVVALGFAAVGFVIVFLALREFKAVDTTVNPLEPESATSLVKSGIFGVTRNPMYLGLLLVLTGWGVWLGSMSNIAVVIVFVVVISELQIKSEEAALGKLFGVDYAEYCQHVRRWI